MIDLRFGLAFGRVAVLASLSFFLAGLPAAATVVGGIGQNFTASILGTDSTALPPDCNGTVGPTNYVEFINGRYSVYDKATATLVQTFTDLTFWSRAGVNVPTPRWAVTDPRLVYDPLSQRWFALQVDFDTRNLINSNHFLVAVSSTIDPTGPWNGVSITSDPTASSTADFPTLGLDSQGVYVSGDMFDVNGNIIGTAMVSVPKADLLAETPSVANLTLFTNLAVASYGLVFQPAVALDGSGQGNILTTASLGFDPSTGNFVNSTRVVTFTVQNAAGPGSATLNSPTFIRVPAYTAPIDPPQPDGSTNLSNGDARFGAAVYQLNGILYAIHNTEVTGRAALRWYRIDANTAAVLETGVITDQALDLFYPSIAANANGTIVIGFNGCSLTSYVNCYAMVGETVNGVTTFGNRMLLKAGVASYQDSSGGAESRWGDYSTTTVDASDPTSFWTIQMYPADGSTWATQITQIRTAPLLLNIAPAGTNVVLSWTSLAGGAQLQSNSSLSSSNSWSAVNQNASTNGSIISVSVPASTAPQFFRLKL